MPYRKQLLVTNEVYHVVNRGVASLSIFDSENDYKRFANLVNFYSYSKNELSFSKFLKLNLDLKKEYLLSRDKNYTKNIDIFSYNLMPNHFHFLIRQLRKNGIQETLSRVQNAYARYYNLKNNRLGPLFQSRFKAVRIENDDILKHVSRYIHLNPVTSYLIEVGELENYYWSSYPDYLGIRDNGPIFVNKDFILNLFGNATNYKKFVLDQVDYQRKLARLKKLTLE
jgi:Protein of unknown function (DUF1568).